MFYILLSVITLFLGLIISYWGFATRTDVFSILSYLLIGGYFFYLSYNLFKTRNMTKQDKINDWEKKRKKGVISTIIFKGILGWGLPIGFISWTLNGSFEEQSLILEFIHFLFYMGGGALMGWSLWANMEREFEEYSKHQG